MPEAALRHGVHHALRTIVQRHADWVAEGRSGYAFIAPDFGLVGHHYVASVLRGTLDEAVSLGLVELGEPAPVPEYEDGRRQWRWDEGRTGRTVKLTRAGWDAFTRTRTPADPGPAHSDQNGPAGDGTLHGPAGAAASP